MSVRDRGAAWPAPTVARPQLDRPQARETHAGLGAGVAVYVDENHTTRRAGGRWLVMALVLDTDPFREVGKKGKKGEMLRGM
jgi:hypothetical protein